MNVKRIDSSDEKEDEMKTSVQEWKTLIRDSEHFDGFAKDGWHFPEEQLPEIGQVCFLIDGVASRQTGIKFKCVYQQNGFHVTRDEWSNRMMSVLFLGFPMLDKVFHPNEVVAWKIYELTDE